MLPNLSKRFGVAVRRRRIAAGLSQETLAEKADLHPTYMSMVERGVRNPTIEVAARISRALRMGLPDLIIEAQHLRASTFKKQR